MAYVPLENLVSKTNGSVYKLVILAAKRALEIAEGSPKLVNMDSSIKPSTIALHEIAEDKVVYKKSKAS